MGIFYVNMATSEGGRGVGLHIPNLKGPKRVLELVFLGLELKFTFLYIDTCSNFLSKCVPKIAINGWLHSILATLNKLYSNLQD